LFNGLRAQNKIEASHGGRSSAKKVERGLTSVYPQGKVSILFFACKAIKIHVLKTRDTGEIDITV